MLNNLKVHAQSWEDHVLLLAHHSKEYEKIPATMHPNQSDDNVLNKKDETKSFDHTDAPDDMSDI